MMQKIVIIDDEKKAVETIKIIIEEYIPNCTVVGFAYSAFDGIKVIQETQPDLVLLDIEMPVNNGFDMLELIPNKNFETIFITAYDQYAIKAIRFSAFDYLLKPVSIDSLKQSLEIFTNQRQRKDNERYQVLESVLSEPQPSKIALAYSKGIQYISLKNIIYLSADRSYTTFHLVGGEQLLLTNRSLTEFESLLEPDFFRIHRSFLINLNHVDKFSNEDGGLVIMSNKDDILVSRRRRELFIEKMNQKLRT